MNYMITQTKIQIYIYFLNSTTPTFRKYNITIQLQPDQTNTNIFKETTLNLLKPIKTLEVL